MRIRQAFLVAALSTLALAGCNGKGSPTELKGSDQFYVTVTLNDASRHSTLEWVQLSIDNIVVDDSCFDIVTDYDENGIPTGSSCNDNGSASVSLAAKNRIAPGPHVLRISILQQSSNELTRYNVDPFTMEISDASGKVLKDIDFAALSDRLQAGQFFYYNFTV
jgi:hypothetical protein